MNDSDIRQRLAGALSARFGDSFELPDDLQGTTTLAGLAEHRTCRRFAGRPVAPDLLKLVIACALSAPSKSDLMQSDIVVVDDGEPRETIAELIPTMEWIREAPVLLVICGNGRRLRQLSELHQVAFANDHLDALFNPSVDAGLTLGFALAAAEAVGLGACPISVIRDHSAAVSDLLDLPELVFPVCGLALGWPQQKNRGISARLPLSVTMHSGHHDDRDFEAEVTSYDRRRAELEGWDPASPEFVGWSKQKARMYARTQRADFGAFLRGRGFKLD